MDITMYIGIGVAIGSAIGGVATAIISIRKQKYTQAKDEFKTLLIEIKQDRDKANERMSTLEQKLEQCKEEHLLMKSEVERLKGIVK